MRSLFAAVLGLAIPLWPASAPAPQRWAVVVGVGDYRDFGDEVGGDLQGPVNDALAIRDALVQRWGFPDDHVRLLLDGEASKAAMQEAITGWIPSRARPGDLVVVYFAGHGSQAWDEDGDEADGLDETLAPHDALRDSPDNDISDDDLRAWLRPLGSTAVVVILDSCHSGTATRAVYSLARPRALNRSLEVIPGGSGDRTRSLAPTEERGDPLGAHVLEIAASQADQAAMDVAWPAPGDQPPVWGGAFTTLLARHLWQAPQGSTYDQLFSRVEREMRREGFAQQPRISGAPLRGIAAFLPPDAAAAPPASGPERRFHVLGAAAGGTVRVDGGSAAGLTPGTLLRAGETVLRVEHVEATHAVASVLGAPPPAGAPAMLVAYRPPVPRLRLAAVGLPRTELATLHRVVGPVDAVVVPDTASYADLVLRAEGTQRLLTGRDGTLRHRIEPLDAPGAADRLRRVLAQEIAARRLGSLDNPARSGEVELALGGGADRLAIGEAIELRVRSARDGHLTVVDLSPDGAVTLLFPNEYDGDDRVAAGRWLEIPTPAMRRQGAVLEAVEPAGEGLVRAFVTARPLALAGDGEWRVTASAIVEALAEAVGRGPLDQPGTLAVDSWSSVAIPYRVDR